MNYDANKFNPNISFDPPPVGKHRVRIEEAEEQTSKSGNTMIRVSFSGGLRCFRRDGQPVADRRRRERAGTRRRRRDRRPSAGRRRGRRRGAVEKEPSPGGHRLQALDEKGTRKDV